MADSTLAALPAATTLTGSELVYGVQSGGDVKVTTTQIKTLSVGPGSVSVTNLKTLTVGVTMTLTAADDTGVYTFPTGTATLLASGGALGTPSSGNLLNCTFPTLNQNTTGSAAKLTTARAIYGNNFDGTEDLTQIIASTFGGTGNGFTKFSGPASTEKTITLPNSNMSVAALDIASQTLSGGAHVTVFDNGTKSSGTFTVDCGNCPLQKCVNGGAFTLAAPAADGSCMLQVTNNGTAGAITFSGFSVGSNTGDALTTTNTQIFTISIWRINGVSGYRIAASQ